MHELVRWFFIITGSRNEAGGWYGFWSGFGGSIPDFLILASIVQVYRTHTCAHRPCRRWAHHITKAGHRLCKIHIGKGIDELELPHINEDHQ